MTIQGGLEKMIDEWKQVVVYADRHTGLHDEKCDLILKQYMKDYQQNITHVVDLGDGIDNPNMSIFPVSPEVKESAQEEFDMYARHINEIKKILPKATIYIIKGNHDEARLSNAKTLNQGLASLRNLEFDRVLKEAITHEGGTTNNLVMAGIEQTLQLTKNNKVLFTHGDPRINPNIKGGITGVRRTAESYPFDGSIYMGHGHHYIAHPRRYPGQQAVMLGGTFNIEKMQKAYTNSHPYTNGFGIISYNKAQDKTFFQYITIKDGTALINGEEFKIK